MIALRTTLPLCLDCLSDNVNFDEFLHVRYFGGFPHAALEHLICHVLVVLCQGFFPVPSSIRPLLLTLTV